MTKFDISKILKHEWLAPNIVRVVATEGVELTEAMALKAYAMVSSEVDEPFAVINDRVNEYENTLEVLAALNDYPDIIFHAIVIHHDADRPVVETQQMLNPALKIFDSMEAAVAAAHAALDS